MRLRSKTYSGIDRDVFVRFCPIPVSMPRSPVPQGLWNHRLYNMIKYFSVDDFISFEEFILGLRKWSLWFTFVISLVRAE